MNILILTGSYGGGHNAAARALKNYYEKKGDKVKIVDIIDFINKFLANSTKTFYKLSSEEYPSVWETFFNVTDYPIVARILYGIKDPIGQPKFNKLIEEFQPDKVISVFPFWNWWVKNYIKSFGHKFSRGIVVTDAVNIQSFWYVREKYVDKYFVIDELSKKNFVEKFNYDSSKVVVSFFPIEKEKFVNKQKIGNKKILLLLTALPTNFVFNFIKKYGQDFDIHIVKGRNEELFSLLKIFDFCKFYEFMPILDELKNFDIVVAKPGGALMSECIATDTPLFFPVFFPGQEEGNKILLEHYELGFFENDEKKLYWVLKYFDFSRMLSNFKQVKKENSLEIIDKALS